MGADTLLAGLIARGITLTPEGTSLRARGKLTDEDRVSIRAHKTELLAVLTATAVPEPQAILAPASAVPPAVHVACSACRHLDGGHCGVRSYYPVLPHIPMRLCGKYQRAGEPGADDDVSGQEGIPHA